MADILVTGATIITMDPSRRVIEDGAVAIKETASPQSGPGPKSKPNIPPRQSSMPNAWSVSPALLTFTATQATPSSRPWITTPLVPGGKPLN